MEIVKYSRISSERDYFIYEYYNEGPMRRLTKHGMSRYENHGFKSIGYFKHGTHIGLRLHNRMLYDD